MATVNAMTLTPTTMPQLSRAELRVLDAISEHELVEDLVSMIQVPSVTGTDAESDLQHRHAARLAALGFDVDTWKLDLDELAAHPDHPGTEARRTEGYGVVGVLGPTEMPSQVRGEAGLHVAGTTAVDGAMADPAAPRVLVVPSGQVAGGDDVDVPLQDQGCLVGVVEVPGGPRDPLSWTVVPESVGERPSRQPGRRHLVEHGSGPEPDGDRVRHVPRGTG